MISSQSWQFTIGIAVGALIIGGITSAKIFEKTIEDKNNPQYKSRNDSSFWPNSGSRNSSFWPNSGSRNSSFWPSSSRNSLYNYTTAARPSRTLSNYSKPISRTRSNYTASPFIRQQNRNLDFNYSKNRTRSVNRGVGVTYNM